MRFWLTHKFPIRTRTKWFVSKEGVRLTFLDVGKRFLCLCLVFIPNIELILLRRGRLVFPSFKLIGSPILNCLVSFLQPCTREKNRLEVAGFEPGSPAQQASRLSILPTLNSWMQNKQHSSASGHQSFTWYLSRKILIYPCYCTGRLWQFLSTFETHWFCQLYAQLDSRENKRRLNE